MHFCFLLTKTVIIGKTESKRDHTVPVSRENLPGYGIFHCYGNRNDGGVTCCMRKDLRFDARTLHCKEIENLLFHILLLKSKPIAKEVFYKTPNHVNFMDLRIEKKFI